MSTDEQEYYLRWDEFQGFITSHLESLRVDQDFTDVTLICEGGLSIHAHRVVLSACSPLFKGMFKNNPCTHPIIFMHDIDKYIMQSLLVFMYTSEVKVRKTQLEKFMQIAESLQVCGLTANSLQKPQVTAVTNTERENVEESDNAESEHNVSFLANVDISLKCEPCDEQIYDNDNNCGENRTREGEIGSGNQQTTPSGIGQQHYKYNNKLRYSRSTLPLNTPNASTSLAENTLGVDQSYSAESNDFRKMTRIQASLLFTPAELANSTLSGKPVRGRRMEEVKPMLDPARVEDIELFVTAHFPRVDRRLIRREISFLCNQNYIKLKKDRAKK